MRIAPEQATLDYSDEPAVLIFATGEAKRAAAAAEVRAAGGRVSAALPLAAALERLDQQPALAAVLAEVEEDGGSMLDTLLDRLDDNARCGRHNSVVVVPPHLIDVAVARAGHAGVTLLSDPDPFDRAAAIGAAIARRAPRLADIGSENNGSRLKEISEEVARIARALASLAGEEPGRTMMAAPQGGDGEASPADPALIRMLIRARRLRAQFFPAELFADPAWDMLLDLAAARLEGRAVAVSSLCIASAVPPTTALRWIKTLTDGHLFARVADSNDGRRVFIELTEHAYAGMMGYLTALQRMTSGRA